MWTKILATNNVCPSSEADVPEHITNFSNMYGFRGYFWVNHLTSVLSTTVMMISNYVLDTGSGYRRIEV